MAKLPNETILKHIDPHGVGEDLSLVTKSTWY